MATENDLIIKTKGALMSYIYRNINRPLPTPLCDCAKRCIEEEKKRQEKKIKNSKKNIFWQYFAKSFVWIKTLLET